MESINNKKKKKKIECSSMIGLTLSIRRVINHMWWLWWWFGIYYLGVIPLLFVF